MKLGILFITALALVSSDGTWFPYANIAGLALFGYVGWCATWISDSTAIESEIKRINLKNRCVKTVKDLYA